MTVEELLVSIMNPNASDAEFRVEVRKSDGYWFVDAIEDWSYPPSWKGEPQPKSFQYYATDLQQALDGLFRMQQEALQAVKS